MPTTLAHIVVSERLVEPQVLAEAERHAGRTGEPLVVALIELAHVDEAAIVAVLRRRLGVEPAAGLDAAEPEALREVAHELARRRRLLPLTIETGVEGPRLLRLAMADPTDADAIAEVEISTGCRVEPSLAPLRALEHAIAHAYRGFVTQVMARTGAAPPGSGPPPPAAAVSSASATTIPPPLRTPFGGDLAVKTPHLPAEAAPHGPSTEPYHHLEDEASLELRLRALVELLQQKGVLADGELSAHIRKLLRERD